MRKEIRLVNKIKHLLRKANIPRWLHHFGPKKYEFYQHILALFVKEICRLSFRRASKFLHMLGMSVPGYSALCKMRRRIPFRIWNKILQLTAEFDSNLVAVDSTGFSRTNPSWYYVKRIDRKKPVKRYVKLSAFFDTRRKKFIALRIRAKPRHDIMDIKYLLNKRSSMQKLLGDSAYDSESLHEIAYVMGIITIIKPRKNVRRGFYRKKQMECYREKTYHRREMIEAGFGGMKRRYGSYVSGRTISSQNAEIHCRAAAYNLRLGY